VAQEKQKKAERGEVGGLQLFLLQYTKMPGRAVISRRTRNWSSKWGKSGTHLKNDTGVLTAILGGPVQPGTVGCQGGSGVPSKVVKKTNAKSKREGKVN